MEKIPQWLRDYFEHPHFSLEYYAHWGAGRCSHYFFNHQIPLCDIIDYMICDPLNPPNEKGVGKHDWQVAICNAKLWSDYILKKGKNGDQFDPYTEPLSKTALEDFGKMSHIGKPKKDHSNSSSCLAKIRFASEADDEWLIIYTKYDGSKSYEECNDASISSRYNTLKQDAQIVWIKVYKLMQKAESEIVSATSSEQHGRSAH